MEYVRLGDPGLRVEPARSGLHELRRPDAGAHTWTLDEEASQPFFRQAVELGVTFWDTANVYQAGTSEEFVGRAIKRTRAARTSCWPPSCTARCTTAPEGRGCLAKQFLKIGCPFVVVEGATGVAEWSGRRSSCNPEQAG